MLFSLRLQFGRCSVQTYYCYALEVLRQNLELFSTFIEHKVSLDKAEEVSRGVFLRVVTHSRTVLPAV